MLSHVRGGAFQLYTATYLNLSGDVRGVGSLVKPGSSTAHIRVVWAYLSFSSLDREPPSLRGMLHELATALSL